MVPIIAIAALAIAGVSLWRLSRLPRPLPAVIERTYGTLEAGDVVLVPDGDWLVADRSAAEGGQADAWVIALRSGREHRWLLAGAQGPVALLPEKPQTADVERALASLGGKKLDRATVELLPGASLRA